MSQRQPLKRQRSQPDLKRHGGIFDILGKTLKRFKKSILHDIGCIQTSANLLFHPQIHHPPEPRAEFLSQLGLESLV